MKKQRTFSIILIIIVSLIIVLGLSITIYITVVRNSINQVYFEDAYKNNEEIAESAVDFLESSIQHEISSIIAIEVAHHNILGAQNLLLDTEYYHTMMQNSNYIKRIEVLSLDGDILYSTNESENRVGINVKQYYLFDPLTDIHQLSFGNVIYDTTNNELALEIAYSGEDVIVSALVSVEFFSIYGQSFQDSFENKELMILTSEGKFLYDSYENQHLIQTYYDDFELLPSFSTTDTYTTFKVNDVDSIINVELATEMEWRVIIYESLDSALSVNNIATNYFSFTFLTILIISITIFVFIDFLLIRDFKLLVNRLNSIEAGDFGEDIEQTNINEINVLRTGFNKMKNSLKESTDRLTYLAYHDDLTGLPSKNKAMRDFKETKDYTKSITFLYIDINRFEVINDNFGYDFGDKMLQCASSIIKNFIDKLYRVQSDEFLGFIYNQEKESIFNSVEKIIKILEKGVSIDEITIPISIKIGIARYPNHGQDFQEIIKKSIISNHEIKTIDGKKYQCFDDSKSDRYIRMTKIELLLNQALRNDDFTVYYQPIIYSKDQSIRGFEALSRWTNDDLGVISPDEFIPILERTNRISILDRRVIEKTIRFNKYIEQTYQQSLIACVNVSVETIMQKDFTSFIKTTIEKYDYTASCLEIEITESNIVKDFNSITKKMKELRTIGVKFSEDDFGDAYSSLTYLTRLEVDTLKISRNFLSSILSNVQSRVLIQTILDLAKKLGFYTVVEGVEDEQTFELFKSYGCNFVQGFLFYKPMSEESLLNLFDKKYKKE